MRLFLAAAAAIAALGGPAVAEPDGPVVWYENDSRTNGVCEARGAPADFVKYLNMTWPAYAATGTFEAHRTAYSNDSSIFMIINRTIGVDFLFWNSKQACEFDLANAKAKLAAAAAGK